MGKSGVLYEPENMDPSLNSNIGSNKSLYGINFIQHDGFGSDETRRYSEWAQGVDLVVQPLIVSKNQDLRVYVIGKNHSFCLTNCQGGFVRFLRW